MDWILYLLVGIETKYLSSDGRIRICREMKFTV